MKLLTAFIALNNVRILMEGQKASMWNKICYHINCILPRLTKERANKKGLLNRHKVAVSDAFIPTSHTLHSHSSN